LQIATGNPYILNFWQGLIEYALAFTVIGLAGIFANSLHQAIKEENTKTILTSIIGGVLLGGSARFLMHFIAGIIFFGDAVPTGQPRSEEHTSELQSRFDLVCRLLLEKKNLILLSYTSEPSPPSLDLHSFPTRRSSDLWYFCKLSTPSDQRGKYQDYFNINYWRCTIRWFCTFSHALYSRDYIFW